MNKYTIIKTKKIAFCKACKFGFQGTKTCECCSGIFWACPTCTG